QIGPHCRQLLAVGQLVGTEFATVPPATERPFARRAEIPDPGTLTARRHQVRLAIDLERIHDQRPALSRLAATEYENLRALQVEPECSNEEPGQFVADPSQRRTRHPDVLSCDAICLIHFASRFYRYFVMSVTLVTGNETDSYACNNDLGFSFGCLTASTTLDEFASGD